MQADFTKYLHLGVAFYLHFLTVAMPYFNCLQDAPFVSV